MLYEMLTGRHAFEGEDVSDTLASILRSEPDWQALPSNTPPAIVKMLRRALQKNVRARLPHIGVARFEIEDAQAEPRVVASPIAAMPHRRAHLIVPWALAGVAVATAVVLAGRILRQRELATLGAIRFAIAAPADVTFGNSTFGRGTAPPAPHFAPSPDGRHIAYIAYKADQKPQLWVRRLDTLSARALPGTDDASFPFWSPDSRFIGFFAQGKLKKIDVSGGPPLTICDAPAGEGGTWNRDGVIVFAENDTNGLFRM